MYIKEGTCFLWQNLRDGVWWAWDHFPEDLMGNFLNCLIENNYFATQVTGDWRFFVLLAEELKTKYLGTYYKYNLKFQK